MLSLEVRDSVTIDTDLVQGSSLYPSLFRLKGKKCIYMSKKYYLDSMPSRMWCYGRVFQEFSHCISGELFMSLKIDTIKNKVLPKWWRSETEGH